MSNWTTLSVKDAGGTSRTMRMWDESGSGAGPFSFAQVLADGTGAGVALPAGTNTIGKVDHTTSGIGHSHKEVTTAGTPVQLASQAAKWVTIQAYLANTGKIAVGATGVSASATIGTGTGFILSAGDSITLPITNTNLLYIDSTVNGEGIRYVYGS